MPGIVGLVSRRVPEECQQRVRLMLQSMMHEPFYVSGHYSAPELGVYGGWVAHQGSFAVNDAAFNKSKDFELLFSGECVFDQCHLTHVLAKNSEQSIRAADYVLPLYDKLGEQFVRELNGQFSGLLIDKRRGIAFLFNDRYGSERLYWHEDAGEVYFASEAKAILRVMASTRTFDRAGVAQFLAYGCTFRDRTIFHNVKLLPGGSVVKIHDTGWVRTRYFDKTELESLPPISPEDFQNQFEEKLQRIIPRYVDSTSITGISLTGGLDTRMILAAANFPGQSVSYTFTGDNGTTVDDRLAAQVAGVCGFEHYLIRLQNDFLAQFPSYGDRTVFVTDGCFGITGAHEIYFNAQARKLAPVRLTGLFGSEILRSVSTFKPLGLPRALLSGDISPSVIAAERDLDWEGQRPVPWAAFHNIPMNLFGAVAASRSQVTLRTPYLDNELVSLAFQAPDEVLRSAKSSLTFIKRKNPALWNIPTDRRVEDRDAVFPRNLRRIFAEATFKIDYLRTQGRLTWITPVDYLMGKLHPRLKIFGQHKFLNYRSWFCRELRPYVNDVLTDDRVREMGLWSADFLERIVRDNGKRGGNYREAINVVLTLESVERLLFRDFPVASL